MDKEEIEKLKELSIIEREDNKKAISKYLQTILSSICKNPLKLDVYFQDLGFIDSPLNTKLGFDVYFLNMDNSPIFGSEIYVSFDIATKELKLNCGSVGSINKSSRPGKYYSYILMGQMFLREKELCERLSLLSWDYNKVYEIYK